MNKSFLPSLLAVLLLSVASGQAQSSSVTITATDSNASESGPNAGTLLVRRSGDLNLPLTVFYRTGGVASNGVDYLSLSNSVTLPPGAATATITITPIDDTLVEGNESVLVRLATPLNVPPGGNYSIIAPDNAFVIIADNDHPATNQPSSVSIVSPANGATFAAPADIWIFAHAEDVDGFVQTVEFFEGTHSLGVATNNPNSAGPMNPFRVNWTNVPPGNYTLTARATDSSGASSVSDPIHITVFDGVNIYVTDPDAYECCGDPNIDPSTDPAIFTVRRSAETNEGIVVYYEISGTASNGIDYLRRSGQVTIPAGALSAQVVIRPLDDDLVEDTETVVLTLIPPCPQCLFSHPMCEVPQGTNCYPIGPHNKAVAYIHDNDGRSNLPPTVRITAPVNGAAFPAGSDITIDAVTTDPDGYAPRVEFFANNTKISEQEIVFIQRPPDGQPIYFSFVWSNVVAGDYTLTARATDDQGAMGVSTPVHIVVGGTSAGPVVTIRAPDAYAAERSGLRGTNTNPAGNTSTNTALFTIHRTGETNSALTVFYSIAGSASNGVDYVRLSDNVIIPAGRRLARITIVPVDDAVAEHDESVVLTLRLPSSSANTASPYVIGRPDRAAAVIADDDRPLPICRRLADGLFHVCWPGTNGDSFSVQSSTDLNNWIPLCTNTVIDGALDYVDPDLAESPRCFYRLVPEPQPVSEE